jgi:beta-lactamase regulating signal transducer with metallopeptidase domain
MTVHVLLNWLWQGCVVALATVAVLRVLRLVRATERYYMWWTALCFVIALPVIPSISSLPGDALVTRSPDRLLPVVSLPDTAWASSIAVILWCAWVALYTARIAVALVALRRAQARSRPIPSAFETRLRHWGRIRERGRRTRLVISDGVRSAAVLGVIAPRIALAPTLLEQLNDDDLDRVVAHEWAHVQRRDDVANLIQLLVRAIVGWHPAVWWIDRQLRFEREVACDDTAVRITGAPKAYAAGLATLASLLPERVAALPVPGVLSSSGIRKRIVRILAPKPQTSAVRTFAAAAIAAVSLSAIAWCVAAFDLVRVGPAPVAETVSTDLVPAIVVRSESDRAPVVAEPRRMSPRAAPVPTRGMTDKRRPTTPSEPVTAPLTVESNLFATGSAAPPPVDPPPLPATALSGRIDQAHLPFATTPMQSASRESHNTASPVESARPPSPWAAATDAGVAVGRSSKNAAVATAGAFSRFGKRIAGSF